MINNLEILREKGFKIISNYYQCPNLAPEYPPHSLSSFSRRYRGTDSLVHLTECLDFNEK